MRQPIKYSQQSQNRRHGTFLLKCSYLHSDRGVFLPLAATVAFVIIVIVAALGFDTVKVKLVSDEAKSNLDRMCRAGATGLPITATAVNTILQQFNEFLLYLPTPIPGAPPPARLLLGSQITNFDIMSPTSPEVAGISLVTTPALGDTTLPCGNSNGVPVNCRFRGNVSFSEIGDLVPAGFWSTNNFGDIVACHMTVAVQTLLSGTRTVNVTVAWELKGLGGIYPPDPAAVPSAPNTRGQNGFGLIVAVDPSITTRASDPRELFPLSSTYDSTNPLRLFDSTSPPSLGVLGFGGSRPAYTSGSIALAQTPALSGDQRKERLHACLPLVAAVRNRFLIGIVGRMRGWGRDKFSLYTINPIGKDRTGIGDLGSGALLPQDLISPPSRIVPFGSDIMRSNFLLPYVRIPLRDAAGTWGELSPSNDNERALLGSLADCYHLYGGNITGILRGMDPLLINSGIFGGGPVVNFETGLMLNTSTNIAVGSSYLTGFNMPWDQSTGSLTPANFLSTEQIVATLGTVQLCPTGSTSAFPCLGAVGKPPRTTGGGSFTNDLRGDVRGFLAAVNGRYIRPDNSIIPNFNAYNSEDLPGGLAPSAQPGTQAAPLLIVLHNRLSQPEALDIRRQVDRFSLTLPGTGPFTKRRIIVAYFPVAAEDLSTVAIDRLKLAFNVSTVPYPAAEENLLMVFGPQGSGCTTPSSCDTALRDYWLNALQAGPQNISRRTYQIFRRIFTESPKL